MKQTVLIAGAGLAGMATALRLAKRGYDVTILEKNESPGGRLNRLEQDGFTFDTGPTFFSMSYEFEEFAKDCGIELPFRYHAVDPLYTVNFGVDDNNYTLHRNLNKLASEFREAEPGFEVKMKHFLRKTGQLFHDSMDIVVRQNFDSAYDYFSKLSKVNKIHLPFVFSTVRKEVDNCFESEEVRQIMSLSAYFLGNSPEKTNGVYSLLSYTEFIYDGYHNVEGGMYEIVRGLEHELQKTGVRILCNREITDYGSKEDKVTALKDKEGNTYRADHFIINSDALLFRSRILKRNKYNEKRLKKMDWSMGMMTIYVGLDCKLDQIALHNYYIGRKSDTHSMNNFGNSKIPESPYFYVNVPSRYNKTHAPEGCEALMFVVPVPNLLHKKEWNDAGYIAENILKEFSARIGMNILPHIRTKKIFTPESWQDRYNLYSGAALGLSHSMQQTGGLRPSNKDEKFVNLYYTGSSTVPGIGLPMAIISSRLTAERVIGQRIEPVYT